MIPTMDPAISISILDTSKGTSKIPTGPEVQILSCKRVSVDKHESMSTAYYVKPSWGGAGRPPRTLRPNDFA